MQIAELCVSCLLTIFKFLKISLRENRTRQVKHRVKTFQTVLRTSSIQELTLFYKLTVNVSSI